MRCSQALFAVPCVAFLLISACVDPTADYKDYVKRTESFRVTGGDSGPVDSMAPTMSIKGTYYLSCLPGLAFGDINKLFRFYAESEFTPNMSGGGGKLTLKLTPMKIRDANDPNMFISASTLKLHKEATGLLQVMDTPVAADGKFTANFGTAMVALLSNPISPRDITVENTTVVGYFQEKAFCGGLSGMVTMPISQDLGAPSKNVCLFEPGKDEDPLPMHVDTDYKCPGL